jgi:hypothetical protein
MCVSRTIYNKTLEDLLPFFFNLLAPLITFGTYEQRMEAAFKYYNEYITYLCDGTVQEIHATTDLAIEGNFFSAKNNMHALSLLVFCNSRKKLLHLTPYLYGCIKDDDLLIRTLSIWGPELTPKDCGFGDSGFRMSEKQREKLTQKGLPQFRIYTPVGEHKTEEYKIFSSHRIIVCLSLFLYLFILFLFFVYLCTLYSNFI